MLETIKQCIQLKTQQETAIWGEERGGGRGEGRGERRGGGREGGEKGRRREGGEEEGGLYCAKHKQIESSKVETSPGLYELLLCIHKTYIKSFQ